MVSETALHSHLLKERIFFSMVFPCFLLSTNITENTAVTGHNQGKYDEKNKFHDKIK